MLKIFAFLKNQYRVTGFIMLLLGLFVSSMTSYAFPWFSTVGFNAKYALPLIILLSLVTFLSIYGPAIVEVSLRQCFIDWMVKNLKKYPQCKKDLIALESVHITGLIEKFIWSLTDFIKLAFSLIFGIIVFAGTSLSNFFLTLFFSFFIFYAIYISQPIAFRIRKNIAKSNRILVKCFDKQKTDINREKSKLLQKSISYIFHAQKHMIMWRSVTSFFAISIGTVLIIAGLLLASKNIMTGIFVVFSGSIMMEKIHKLIDAFIVLQGETIHFDEIQKALVR